jgi:hypothetical protein
MDKGYISKDYYACCGLCKEFEMGIGSTQHEALVTIRRLGWLQTRDNGWVCPYCQDKRKEAAQNYGYELTD